MVQLLYLWPTQKYLFKLNIFIFYDLIISFLGIYSTEMLKYIHLKPYMIMFVEAPLIISWKLHIIL